MLAFVQMSFSQKGFVELVKIVVEFRDINSQRKRDLGKSLEGEKDAERCYSWSSLGYGLLSFVALPDF